MNTKIVLIFTIALLLPLVAQADRQSAMNNDATTRARLADSQQHQQHSPFEIVVDDSIALYKKVVKGPQGEVPASVLDNARCIAILPGVVTGAFVVGGTHGDGLASCKDNDNEWSHPAAITLSKGSIGLQAGVKSADLVLFFQTEKAEQALKRGDLTLGGDISAVAGSFDREVNTSDAGVVVYTHSRGLFAGASVEGSKIGKNQDDLEEYYGQKVDYQRVLEGSELSDSPRYAQNLVDLFPAS